MATLPARAMRNSRKALRNFVQMVFMAVTGIRLITYAVLGRGLKGPVYGYAERLGRAVNL
jgi:hypothetical protein